MKKLILLTLVGAFAFSGCSYTQSALEYAKEGTQRVEAGYDAKAKLTDSLVAYLKGANKDCGVKTTVINNIPTTTVKECVRVQDVLSLVDKVEIVKPQKVSDIANGVGDFFLKATNLVVPTAQIYYGHKNHAISTNANIEMTKSNNEMNTKMIDSYTSNFENTSASNSETTTNTTFTTNTVPNITVDTNSTRIGGE